MQPNTPPPPGTGPSMNAPRLPGRPERPPYPSATPLSSMQPSAPFSGQDSLRPIGAAPRGSAVGPSPVPGSFVQSSAAFQGRPMMPPNQMIPDAPKSSSWQSSPSSFAPGPPPGKFPPQGNQPSMPETHVRPPSNQYFPGRPLTPAPVPFSHPPTTQQHPLHPPSTQQHPLHPPSSQFPLQPPSNQYPLQPPSNQYPLQPPNSQHLTGQVNHGSPFAPQSHQSVTQPFPAPRGPPVFPGAPTNLAFQPPQTIPNQYSRPSEPQISRGPVQGLAEEFQSLSLASVPGSIEPKMDLSSLPRPQDESAIEDPPSSTFYTANCHSRYLRFTTNAIPNAQSLMSRWHLPLGAVVHPLAEAPGKEEIPVVDFGGSGIVRCKRCRTYINPYVIFTDNGRRWKCNVCSLLNEVTADYQSPLDMNGRRQDADQRPELCNGSVEFVAPTEYMVRPPMPPLYFFLIDVSYSAVKRGMLKVAVETIKSCLDKLPGFPRTQIGFLTFDSSLHFYNLKSSLTQPQMMVVGDLEEPFVPLPDDLLVNLSDSRSVVDVLLDSLPAMFEDNTNIESAFGPALKAAFMVMSQLGGKLLIFQSTLPSLGVGRLKLRGNDPRIYGTDKEHTIRTPEDPFYKQMAADLTKYQIGVNLYAFSETYTDLASLGTLAKYTGGQVYYYPSFDYSLHKEKFTHELARDLTRETAWEAVLRIRCGKGVRFTTYHGHFMLRSSDLLALPAVDCDKAFAMQLSLEETLLTSQTVYFQVALLYTSSSGERRIRVHTMALPVVSDLGALYQNADIGAIMGLLSRITIEKSLSSKLEEARNTVQLKIVRCLREYRNLYAVQHRVAGQFIYPESLKLLCLYGLALCKSLPLRGNFQDAQIDERSAAGFTMMVIPIRKLLKLLYPSLIRLDNLLLKSPSTARDDTMVFQQLPLTAEMLDSTGLYLFDDGFRFVLWLGKALSVEFVKSLLGAEVANSPDLSKVRAVEQNNEISKKLFGILKSIREKDLAFYQHCQLVRQGEQPREGSIMLFNLTEDQISGLTGYVSWMLQIHRQVQQKA